MVNWISSWVQGIIIAVIISTIIEMILPEGSIKKYVKTVIGAYIVFVIISPIIVKTTGKEINLKEYKLPETDNYKMASIDTNSYIKSTYINDIKSKIVEDIETKGYSVKKIEIKIDEQDENYGNINEIELIIEKKEEEQTTLEPIEINISNKTEIIDEIDNKEKEELKEFLKENYGANKEKIQINI